jgi:hypothetical protein
VSDPWDDLKENEWPKSPSKRRDVDGKDRHAYQVARENFRVRCVAFVSNWQPFETVARSDRIITADVEEDLGYGQTGGPGTDHA